MVVAKDCVVSIDYTLKNRQGELIDSSEGEPLEYLHGHRQIVPGLERALEGANDGDTKKVVVSAEDGYGSRDEQAVFAVKRAMFPADAELVAGTTFIGRDTHGNAVPVTVVALEGDQVTIDANHPLAGEELHFEVTVRAVRAATAEELTHGHVHGPGDHDH